jgi:hypothetical protein
VAKGAQRPVQGKWVKDNRYDALFPEFRRDKFFQRLLSALGETPEGIAAGMGVSVNQLLTRYNVARNELAQVDHDPFWITLAEYVDKRMGEVLSVREELQRKLAADRKARLAERLRVETRR